MEEYEVQWAVLICAPGEEVWEQIGSFRDVERWAGDEAEVCVMENAPQSPNTPGARRRVALKDGPNTLLREELLALWATDKRRFMTTRLLPPSTEYEAVRCPFHPLTPAPDPVKITLTVTDIPHQYRSAVEYYATFSLPSCTAQEVAEEAVAKLRAVFKKLLAALQRRWSDRSDGRDLFPTCLESLLTEAGLVKHTTKFEEVSDLWIGKVKEVAELQRANEGLRNELQATQAILQKVLKEGGGGGSGGSGSEEQIESLKEKLAATQQQLKEAREAAQQAAMQQRRQEEEEEEGKGKEAPPPPPRLPTPDVDPRVYQKRGPLVAESDICALFNELDVGNKGYLTRRQVVDYYLATDPFESHDTVDGTLGKFVPPEETTVPFTAFHALMLHRAKQ